MLTITEESSEEVGILHDQKDVSVYYTYDKMSQTLSFYQVKGLYLLFKALRNSFDRRSRFSFILPAPHWSAS